MNFENRIALLVLGMSGEPLDSCGICGTRETPQEQKATRRLPDRPAESEWIVASEKFPTFIFRVAIYFIKISLNFDYHK
jgi:hypothetical protein